MKQQENIAETLNKVPDLVRLSNGVLRQVTLGNGESKTPASPFKWLILNGTFVHITGTTSQVSVMHSKDTDPYTRNAVDTATGTGNYPFFGKDTLQTSWVPIFIEPTGNITLSCSVLGQLRLLVLEF